MVGNPNSGKSHLFNRLTFYNQEVGNWPGVTNDLKYADIQGIRKEVKVIDLPGVYDIDTKRDLSEQGMAADFILNKRSEYDLIFNVIDVDYLERSLHLTQQLIEKNIPVVIILNKSDRLKGAINKEALAEEFGVSVIEANTIQKQGIKNIIEFINHTELAKIAAPLPQSLDIKQVLAKVFQNYIAKRSSQKDEAIDKILMHKVWGLAIFLLIMLLGFTMIAESGLYVQQFITSQLDTWLENGLTYIKPYYLNILLYSLGNSIIMIIGLIPIILLLYLFLSLLEDTGYIPRIMILSDNLMRKFGLNGKAFIPIILGFGCNIPAIMATRIIKDKTSRLKVALIIPFLSCSARLTIFSIFTLIFFEKFQGLVIFSLYLLGMLVAVVTLIILNLFGFKGNNIILYELPRYQMPHLKTWFRKSYVKVKGFIVDAAGIIIIFATIITLSNNVLLNSKHLEIVQNVGHKANKLFEPLGSKEQNWQLPYVLLSGIVAKEAMIASIGSFYKEPNLLEDNQALSSLENVFKGWMGIYSILVFILLCFPCVSVFSILYREFSINVAIFSVIWSLMMGYLVSWGVFQVLSIMFA